MVRLTARIVPGNAAPHTVSISFRRSRRAPAKLPAAPVPTHPGSRGEDRSMSEQGSGPYVPREDDAIKRQDRSELQAHGDQWPEPDSDDDANQPDTAWAPEGRFAGDLPGEDWAAIELRSDLARH